jgi:predicted NodU family carbamoyl transferase
MNVLGLSFSDHEASAALVIDGKLTSAIARERVTRIKRDGIRWGGCRLDLTPAIQYCLESNGLALDDVDLIVWSHTDHLPPDEVYESLAAEGGIDILARPCCRSRIILRTPVAPITRRHSGARWQS